MTDTSGNFTSLVDHVRSKAAQDPNRHAYTFLADGSESDRWSRGELDSQARRIAAQLQERGLAGQRALLLYPPGLEFVAAFLGCLYGGTVAVPAYPPGSKRALPRVASIVADSEPAVVLTSGAQRFRLEKLLAQDPALARLEWLVTDGLDESRAAEWTPPVLRPESLAFLQYTSGSTAAPKGVMVTHGNLVHNEEMIHRAYDQSSRSVIVGWLPLYHDMGLIGNVLQPLYLGASCFLMSPISFLRRPRSWLEAISRYRATTSGGPDFGYDLCVRKVSDDETAALDLSTWRVAYNGAEPVRAETMKRFSEKFAPCGFRKEAFYPCYGLAEATLFVSGAGVDEAPCSGCFDAEALEEHRVLPARDGRELVSCGRAWQGQEVVVVDTSTMRRAGENEVGEIWVSGPSVAAGYWRQPEKTAEDFDGRLTDEPESGPYLRTGDLGFFLDGELYVTGRHKDLIILRGRNHYPQDVERSAERAHGALRPGAGAAFSVEAGGEEQLVVVWELERGALAQADEAAMAIRQEVSQDHEAQVREVVLLRPGSIPKTTSGKIRRHACRADYLADRLAVVERHGLDGTPADDEEDEVPAALAALGLRREVLRVLQPEERLPSMVTALRHEVSRLAGKPLSRVASGASLTALGVDADGARALTLTVKEGLGIDVPPADVLVAPSVEALAQQFLASLADDLPS